MVRPLFLPVCGFLLVASMAMAQSEQEPKVGIAVFKQGQLVGKIVGLAPERAPETEIFSYQVPDFDPSMRDTMSFRLGSVANSETRGTGGSRVAVPGDDGLLWAEVEKQDESTSMHGPLHRFVTAVNVLDGRGYAFVEQQSMNLVEVAGLLTELFGQMNVVLYPEAERLDLMLSAPRHSPPPEAYATEANIDGAWLSIADVQEQVFQQTRCHLELDQSVYYVAGCEP